MPPKYTGKQEGGNHYQGFVIQPLEFVLRNRLGFAEGCVIKYVARHQLKGGKDDLLKAQHYLEALIEEYYPEGEDGE